jgi:HAD superfamily hydrolase (TIGR01493 family)
MAVMDSPAVWSAAARDPKIGMAWRDAVTARIIASRSYVPYEDLIRDASAELALPGRATDDLLDRWAAMAPRPDARAIERLPVPYAFVTNCSAPLAAIAAARSGLRPAFVLSAEEAGVYKPEPPIYHDACRRLGVAPAATLFVAGAPFDAVGARRAGLPAVLVRRRLDVEFPDGVSVVGSLEEIVTRVR